MDDKEMPKDRQIYQLNSDMIQMNNFLEDSGYGIWQWQVPEDAFAGSKRFKEITGLWKEPSEIIDYRLLIAPNAVYWLTECLTNCIEGSSEGYDETFLIINNKKQVWLREQCRVTKLDEMGNVAVITGLIEDITADVTLKENMQRKVNVYEAISKSSLFGTWTWDIDKDDICINDEITVQLGYTPGFLNGSFHKIANFIHPDDYSRLLGVGKRQQDSFTHRIRMRHNNGAYIWMINICEVTMRTVTGQAAFVTGTLTNAAHTENLRNKSLTTEKEDTGYKRALRLMEAVFESNPYMSLILSDKYEPIDCNPSAIEYFGFRTKATLLKDIISTINGSVPPYQPDGRRSLSFLERLEDVSRSGYLEFSTVLHLDNKPTNMNVLMKRIPFEQHFVIVIYWLDLTSLMEIQTELARQEKLLRAINEAASSLMRATPEEFVKTVHDVMVQIGEAGGFDRMSIWRNTTEHSLPAGNGRTGLFYKSYALWNNHCVMPRSDLFNRPLTYDDIPFWRDSMFGGKTINTVVRELPDAERALFEGESIQAVTGIPLFLNGLYWGFVVFDNCHSETIFAEADMHALLSCANNIISADMRNNMMTSLVEARDSLLVRDKLLSTVNQVATLLLRSNYDDFGESILNSLEMLANNVEVDRAYIWRNSMVDGKLCCSQLYEWCDQVPSIHREPPVNFPYDQLIPNWRKMINEPWVNAMWNEFDEFVTGFPGMEDVKSIFVIPIIIQGDFWGFIGFDDCTNTRKFSEIQSDVMQSGGLLLASAIQNNGMTEKLIEAKEEALRSMHAKSEFLSRMSHEMRTPMNAIIGMNMIAMKSEDSEKINYCLNKIDQSSRQLLQIINDVLDMSKIDANKLEIDNKEFDFKKMLENAFDVIDVKIEEKRQTFHYDIDHEFTRNVISDELRLSQVLINLLSNAVKFTPEQGTITLKIRETPLRENHSRLRVDVIDTGIGIQKDYLHKLFDSFEQGDGGITRQYGGTGLGLSICKKIIDLMGGRIWANSHEEGSIFSFEVDIEWGCPCHGSSSQKLVLKDVKVLAIDPEQEFQSYLKEVFKTFSIVCDVAGDVQSALEQIKMAGKRNEFYNLIFANWKMPGMNQMIYEAKKLMDSNIVIVIDKGLDPFKIERQATQHGIEKFLQKPVTPSLLYDTVVCLTDRSLIEPQTPADMDTMNWQGKKVLLVEDVEINREIVMSILEDTNVTIDIAEDGARAKELIIQYPTRYDLVLMDVQMPIMDGMTATREIRALDDTAASQIPIIAMTANAFKEDEKDCFEAGMNMHVSKPIDVDDLMQKMAVFLNN